MTPIEFYQMLVTLSYIMIGVCSIVITFIAMDFFLYKINVVKLSTHQGKIMREDDKARFFHDRKTGTTTLKLKKREVKDKEGLTNNLPVKLFNDAIPMKHKLGFLRYSLFLLSPEPGTYTPLRLDLDNNQVFPYNSDMRNFYVSTFKTRILSYLQPKLNPAIIGLASFIIGILGAVVIAKISIGDLVSQLEKLTGPVTELVGQLKAEGVAKATSFTPPT